MVGKSPITSVLGCLSRIQRSLLAFLVLFFLFLVPSAEASKLPSLTPQDVVDTLHLMMDAHVECKALTPSLVKKSLEKYLEEIDPTMTYLLHKEVAPWIEGDENLLKEICAAMGNGDFSHFGKIHQLMISAIQRRRDIEEKQATASLPENIRLEDLNEMKWPLTEEELAERLLKIKSLQFSGAEKLDAESREKALQRIIKNRISREDDLLTPDPRDREKLILSYVLKACAASFDAHTAYFTPWEAQQFMIQLQQRLFGIGVQLRDDLNGFTIIKIIEGGPASQNGQFKINDRIIAIDDEPVVGLDIIEAVDLIRGEEGTVVHLTILRPGEKGEEKREIELTRGEVVIQEARIESNVYPCGDGVIAHVTLHSFYQDPLHSSASDLHETIDKIQKEHSIRGLILDLRHNAGGILPQAVSVTGLFITKGIVCSIKNNQGMVEHLRDIDSKVAFDGPLIVLTSKASASASEIVAQTLQDYGRAIIVGDEHTYGKGTFQTFTLDAERGRVNPKGEFKVTRGKYYTVSGKSPQFKGVTPHITAPGFYSVSEIGERHIKNALGNDSIPENFNDDLSDVPLSQRDEISWLYRFNTQPKIKTYIRHLPILSKNSQIRIQNDPLYQHFLNGIQQDEIKPDFIEMYAKVDPQLNETVNIMKDLILLLK